MIYDTIAALKEEISCRELYTLVHGITGFHRIQASPGFEAAANWCVNALNMRGIDAKVLHYPAVKGGFAGAWRLFQQWNCTSGWCRMTWPEQIEIADYSQEPISIIQKSCAADWTDKTLSLIEMDKGCKEENYRDVDLTGKLLFVHQHIDHFSWAIQERGALGLISDYLNETPTVRCPEELLDTLNYTSYWWKHTENEKQAFGFVVSPRMSKTLHEACVKARKAFEKGESNVPYPQLNAFVDAELVDGESHVVEATLPGKSDDCILICAHLCHPCASANDNASGDAAGIEALAAIKRAIEKGSLPPLERTVKLILVPEFTGTYQYFTDGRNRKKYLAGINLDMVGAKQEDTTGPINVTGLPWALPSFTGDLAALLLKAVKCEVKTEADRLLANVLTDDIPFGLGSDHFILSDPMVGIPSVMLGQWPDKYYHTSSDTLNRLDMNVLRFSCLVGAAYVYTLCNLTGQDTELIWNHQKTRCMAQAERLEQEAMLNNLSSQQKAMRRAGLKEFFAKSAQSITDFVHCSPENQLAWIEKALPEQVGFPTGGLAYKRVLDTPIEAFEDLIADDMGKLAAYRAYDKKYEDCEYRDLAECLYCYYLDGVRTQQEAIARVNSEMGKDCTGLLQAYALLLKNCNLIV